MKILHIGTWFGPPINGGLKYQYEYAKRLGQEDRQFFILSVDSFGEEARALETLGVSGEGWLTYPRPHIGNVQRISGLLNRGKPPALVGFEGKCKVRLQQHIKKAIAEWKPDVAIVWSPNLAGVCAEVLSVPTLLFACDSMKLVNQSMAEHSPHGYQRWYHRLVACRYARWTVRAYAPYPHIVFVSSRDQADCCLPVGAKTSVIPLGVDCKVYAPRCSTAVKRKPVLTFHGDLRYVANEEAVQWLISCLLPTLISRYGEDGFILRIIGKCTSRAILRQAEAHPYLEMTGYVDDLAAALGESTCYVAPLVIGGGMKTKILEAMACGLPIVGTEEAFSGQSCQSGIQGIIVPREKMIPAVLELLNSPDDCRRLGIAARQWVEAQRDWNVCTMRLRTILREIVENRNHAKTACIQAK